MKNSTKFVLSMSALALMAAEAATAGFTGYIIRNADNGTAPVINASTSNSINASIEIARQKIGFGSNDVNGRTIGEISLMDIMRNDAGTALKPYVNIWVTNGLGNYAVISISPAQWGGPGAGSLSTSYSTMNGLVTAPNNRGPGQDVYVYETTNATGAETAPSGAQINSNKGTSWLSSRGLGNYLTISDISDLVIAPPPSSWFAGTNGTGSGAPRELGTGLAFGFNWIMGAANPIAGSPPAGYSQFTAYDLSGVSVVPAPGALALLGVAGLVGGRRRRA